MKFDEFRQLIRLGDLKQVKRALDAESELLFYTDLNPEYWEERTALHCAARWAQLDLVKLFVARGAEVYSHPHNSYPAVFIANQYLYFPDRPNARHIVEYFLNEIPEKAEGTLGTGATIHIASRLGFTNVVHKHLELDPLAVHQRGWLGDTPLHWASHNGHVDIVRALLNAGADIEADEINCYGGKPLHWASEHAPEVVKLLLERGANVNSVNQRQQSDFLGVTPLLMNALQKDDCSEVTEQLLAAGADMSITHRGKTALEIAREKGNAKIAAVLEAAAKESADQFSDTVQISRLPDLPARPPNAHKGTFGSVLVVAGSRGMSGAACLAGRAALHAGAGLVTLAVPRSIGAVVSGYHPSYMTIWLTEEAGKVCTSATGEIDRAMEGKTAIAVGPGLGQSPQVQQVVQSLYARYTQPMVLDADGLNAFARATHLLKSRPDNAPRILTPHPGEFARLTNSSTRTIEQNRTAMAVEFARRHDVVLLLKGVTSVITDGKRVARNHTGSSALATGGSGDVLTGLIVSLVAQGMEAFEAAQLGAYLHGLAGEAAGNSCSDRYVTSAEVVHHLSQAWRAAETASGA